MTLLLGVISLLGALFAISGYVQSKAYRIERLEELSGNRDQTLARLSVQIDKLDQKIIALIISINRLDQHHETGPRASQK
jgi:hypothetical protein